VEDHPALNTHMAPAALANITQDSTKRKLPACAHSILVYNTWAKSADCISCIGTATSHMYALYTARNCKHMRQV
jgi:hypothetical protein